MDPILDAIDAALVRKGLSDAAASKLAVGNYALIKNMRSGRSEEKRYNFQALEKLADVLGLECYFGPPRERGAGLADADPSKLAHIPLHEALLSAGGGVENGDERVVDYLAFSRDWMRKIGLSPSNAVLARAKGDSMEPMIWDGDMLLIDRSKIDPPVIAKKDRGARRAPIFALLDNGQAKVKRLQILDGGVAIMMSDNPDHPPQFSDVKTLSIIGKVMWWGHTSKE